MDAIKSVASSLAQPHVDVMKSCMPRILIHILPLFAAHKTAEGMAAGGEDRDALTAARAADRDVQRRVKTADGCYEVLLGVIPQEVSLDIR